VGSLGRPFHTSIRNDPFPTSARVSPGGRATPVPLGARGSSPPSWPARPFTFFPKRSFFFWWRGAPSPRVFPLSPFFWLRAGVPVLFVNRLPLWSRRAHPRVPPLFPFPQFFQFFQGPPHTSFRFFLPNPSSLAFLFNVCSSPRPGSQGRTRLSFLSPQSTQVCPLVGPNQQTDGFHLFLGQIGTALLESLLTGHFVCVDETASFDLLWSFSHGGDTWVILFSRRRPSSPPWWEHLLANHGLPLFFIHSPSAGPAPSSP